MPFKQKHVLLTPKSTLDTVVSWFQYGIREIFSLEVSSADIIFTFHTSPFFSHPISITQLEDVSCCLFIDADFLYLSLKIWGKYSSTWSVKCNSASWAVDRKKYTGKGDKGNIVDKRHPCSCFHKISVATFWIFQLILYFSPQFLYTHFPWQEYGNSSGNLYAPAMLFKPQDLCTG